MNAEFSFASDGEAHDDQGIQEPTAESVNSITSKFAVIHLIVIAAAAGWYFLYLPQLKSQLSERGTNVSSAVIAAAWKLDLLINYWYLLVIPVAILIKMDLAAVRWIATMMGIRDLVAYTSAVTLLLLGYVAFEQYTLLYF